MGFFTDPKGFTHLARFYGFPIYYKEDGPDGCEIAGTNLIWDFCIVHIAPRLHTVIDFMGYICIPNWEGLEGWQIEIVEELE